MSASASKKKRKTQDLDGLNYKELQSKKESEEHKKKTRTILITVLAVLAVVGIIFGVIAAVNAPYRQPIGTVGDQKVTIPVYNCYYVSTANQWVNTLMMYNAFSIGVPFSKQANPTGGEGTMEDFFIATTNSQIEHDFNLYAAAQKDSGFHLSKEGQKSIDEGVKNLKTEAKEHGYGSVNKYLRAAVGKGVTIEDYRKYLTISVTATEYEAYVKDSFDPSADELAAAYAEDPDAYDYVCISYTMTNATGELDKETSTMVYSDQDREEARQKAEEKKENFPEDASSAQVRKDGLDEEMAAWLFDEARQAGDIEVFKADEEGNTYYTIRYDGRDTNDYNCVNVYIISITRDTTTNTAPADAETENPDAEAENPDAEAENPDAEAENPDAEAENPDAEAENPDAEAENPDAEAENPDAEAENTETEHVDTSDEKLEKLTEGLTPEMTDEEFEAYVTNLEYTPRIQSLNHYSSVEEVRDYAFDSSRKAGDYTVITTDTAYYLVRFVSTDEETYRDTLVRSTLLNNKLSDIEGANPFKMLSKALKFANTDLVFGTSSAS